MIEHYLHSVFICDIHTARFPLDCSQAAVCPCTLFRVRCRPHSEGCAPEEGCFETSQRDRHTDGHLDSMTELAQWADSVQTIGQRLVCAELSCKTQFQIEGEVTHEFITRSH